MEMNIEKIASMKLKGLRAEHDLSLEDVAKKMSFHRETIRRYENNPSLMTINVLLKLLKLYNVDPQIFFNETYGKMPYDK